MYVRYIYFRGFYLRFNILCTQNNTCYTKLLPVSVSPLLAPETVHKKSNQVHWCTVILYIFALWLLQIVTVHFLHCTALPPMSSLLGIFHLPCTVTINTSQLKFQLFPALRSSAHWWVRRWSVGQGSGWRAGTQWDRAVRYKRYYILWPILKPLGSSSELTSFRYMVCNCDRVLHQSFLSRVIHQRIVHFDHV